jgi:hypothetical protein
MEDWGVPTGSVAKKLRTILYPGLTDHQVETIVVCLMAHLLIEQKLNGLLYRWLIQNVPSLAEGEDPSKAEEALWEKIVGMRFSKKFKLVATFFDERFPEEKKTIWKINDLRNHIFHGRSIEEAQFEGQPISEERTVERIFLAAQDVSMRFGRFEEVLDSLQPFDEPWKNSLIKFGKSLF